MRPVVPPSRSSAGRAHLGARIGARAFEESFREFYLSTRNFIKPLFSVSFWQLHLHQQSGVGHHPWTLLHRPRAVGDCGSLATSCRSTQG